MQQKLRRQRITRGVPPPPAPHLKKKKAIVVDPHTTHQWSHQTNCSQSTGIMAAYRIMAEDRCRQALRKN